MAKDAQTRLNVSLDGALRATIETLARERKTSMSAIARDALRREFASAGITPQRETPAVDGKISAADFLSIDGVASLDGISVKDFAPLAIGSPEWKNASGELGRWADRRRREEELNDLAERARDVYLGELEAILQREIRRIVAELPYKTNGASLADAEAAVAQELSRLLDAASEAEWRTLAEVKELE